MALTNNQPLPAFNLLSALALLLATLAAIFPVPAVAQSSAAAPAIYNQSSKYIYTGCYLETSGLANTTGARTLSNGAHEVGAGNMTVPACLTYCSTGTTYKYAGVEYSRECWCSQSLSSLATKFADNECNLGCDGDETQVCGGALKLSIYTLSGASAMNALTGALVLALTGATLFNLL